MQSFFAIELKYSEEIKVHSSELLIAAGASKMYTYCLRRRGSQRQHRERVKAEQKRSVIAIIYLQMSIVYYCKVTEDMFTKE